MNPFPGKTATGLLLLILLCVGVGRIAAAAPFAHTQPATLITSNSAVLNGMGAANRQPSVAWFEWGLRGAPVQSTSPVDLGDAPVVTRVSLPISGLTNGGVYECRLAVSNASGVVHGAVQWFTTGARVLAWGRNDYNQTSGATNLDNVVTVAAGNSRGLALRADGTLSLWGYGAYGLNVVPAGLSNAVVVGLAAGAEHSLALRANGTVVAWGNSSSSQTYVPAWLSNVVAVAAGDYQSLALRADGSVVSWAGEAIPADLFDAVSIACGSYHSLALTADRRVVAWGNNTSGQASVPAGLSNVVAIAAGDWHNLALKADGTVVAWGNNYYGQTSVPVGLGNVIEIAAGFGQSAALKADGSLVIWGDNQYAQGSAPNGLAGVNALTCGGDFNLVLAPNQPPQAAAQTVSGPANQDQVIALGASDLNKDPLTLEITSLPANGALYQYAGGVRGPAITETNTPVTDAAGRVIFAPATDGFGEPYAAFSFSASDGTLSSTAVVTVVVVGRPYGFTQMPNAITTTTARLNGMVAPNTFASAAWFEWGPRGTYSQSTAPVSVGAGATAIHTSAMIAGLTNGVAYQCRVMSSNSAGVTQGSVQFFTPGMRVVGWGYNGSGQLDIPPGLTNIVALEAAGNFSLGLKSDGTLSTWPSRPEIVTNMTIANTNFVSVAAGPNHVVALKTDGTVAAWGAGWSGETNVPAGLSNVIAVAAGGGQSWALKSDGSLVGWGTWGTAPASLSNIVWMTSKVGHTLALRADGTVVALGDNGYGQTNVPAGLPSAVALAAGYDHTLIATADGSVTAWGGYNPTNAIPPAGLSNVVAVAAGNAYSLALRRDGTVAAWGANDYGQTTVPSGLTNLVAVTAGYVHALALAPNLPPLALAQSVSGSANQDQVITLGGTDPNLDPLAFRIASLPASGVLYQCTNGTRGPVINTANALVTDAAARVIFAPTPNAFGNPYASFNFTTSDGALSSTATVTIAVVGRPYVHTQPTTRITPATAMLNGMAVPNTFSSTAWFEWGAQGAFNQTTTPVNVGNGSRVVRVSAAISGLATGGVYQCRLVSSNSAGVTFGTIHLFTTGRKVTAWGYNTNDYYYVNYGQALVPASVSNVVAIAAGGLHNVVLKSDGTVFAWGYNDANQTNVPAGLGGVEMIAAGGTSRPGGGSSSLAVKTNGQVVGWGYIQNAAANAPANLTNAISGDVAEFHAVILKADGTLAAWGWSTYATILTNVPPGLSNAVQVATSADHVLALKADGTVVSWGRNDYGQTNVPPALNNVVAVAAGLLHSLALKSDGTVVAWGAGTTNTGNSYAYELGQSVVPAGLSNVVAIAAGNVHCHALKADGTLVGWGLYASVATNLPPGLASVVALASGAAHNLVIGNQTPLASSQSVTGVANADQVIQLSATDPNGDALTLRITTLPVAGTLYQFNGGARGAAIASPNTAVTGSNGRVIFAPVTNGFGAPYASFNFVANDGLVDSTAATATISVNARPFVFTVAPTEIRSENAKLNGCVVPNGLSSVAWFEWGHRGGYTQASEPIAVSSGSSLIRVSAVASNLVARGIYQCRFAVSNLAGVTYAAPQIFTTGRKVLVWGANTYGQTNKPAGMSNIVSLACGDYHTLALTAEGTVRAWGAGSTVGGSYPHAQQAMPPAGLSNVIALAGTTTHSIALKADGTLMGWGALAGHTNAPSDLTNVVDIVTGWGFFAALRADGTVAAWGDNSYGQTNVPAGLSNVVGIAAGWNHVVVLKADGTTTGWGRTNRNQVIAPAGLKDVVAIEAGGYASIAVRSDGRVVTWGQSASGNFHSPGGLYDAVAANCNSTIDSAEGIALSLHDAVTVWGSGDTDQSSMPTGLNSLVGVSKGREHAVVIGNLPPLALPFTAVGPPNRDLTVQFQGSDPNDDVLNYRVMSLPAKGTLYQFLAGARGPVIASPKTAVTDSAGRVIFAPPAGEFGQPYTSFDFLANDDPSDSAPATATIRLDGRPHAFTAPPLATRSNSTTLVGMAMPHNLASHAWLEWGELGSFTATNEPVSIGAGNSVVPVTYAISNLASGGDYQFRLAVSNVAGTIYGAPQFFTTGRKPSGWGLQAPWGLTNVVAISDGLNHALALRADGSLAAWGSSLLYGQANVPIGLSNVIAIDCGEYHNLVLKDDGKLVAWGRNDFGQTNVPVGLSNLSAVAGGRYHSTFLRWDGTVGAWGYNDKGQTNVPPGLSNVVAIAAGVSHNLALNSDGTVVAWGAGTTNAGNSFDYGQSIVPAGLSNVVAISAGSYHSLALRSDGTVAAWGDTNSGQTSVPPGLTNVVAIAAGTAHSLALHADGSLTAWDSEFYSLPSSWSNSVAIAAGGQSVVLRPNLPPVAGPRTASGMANRDILLQLTSLDPDYDTLRYRIISLPTAGSLYQAAGTNRGVAINATNTYITSSYTVVYAPPTNGLGNPVATFGYLADDGMEISAPATVSVTTTSTVAAATLPASFIGTDRATLNGMVIAGGLPTSVWFEWGTNNTYGQTTASSLAYGYGGVTHVAQPLVGLDAGGAYQFRLIASNATGVAIGARQSLATGVRLSTWGRSYSNLLVIPSGLRAVKVAGGGTHSLAVRTDGSVAAWGAGDYYYSNVVNVPANLRATAVSAGDYHSVALRTNGTVAAWGGYLYNNGTETNVPAGLSNVVAISAGGSHTLALRANGSVVAWGINTYGQTNVTVGLGDAIAIAAGGTHSMALKIGGTLVTWGNNSAGQRNVPASLTNAIAIAAGQSHSLALRANGTVVGWGSNNFGQTNTPAGLSNVIQIACGANHNAALRADGSLILWGYNNNGQTNKPAALSNVVDIACGATHSLSLGGNLPPAITNKSVSGYPNQDTLVTLTGGDANGDALGFRVASLPVTGSLHQFTAGGRGTPIIAPGTSVADPTGRIFFAPLPNQAGSPYSSFNVQATDGAADSTNALVTMNIILPPAPQLSATKSAATMLAAASVTTDGWAAGTNGGFALRFNGYTNLPYQVWASTNLIQWTPLGAAVAISNGWFQFVDADSPNWPRRFYRISQASDRAFNLAFSGQSNATYRVWASTNLTDWEPLGTASVTSNGWFNFMDFDAAQFPRRFYKAGAP